jgi:hypothetical protein
MYSGTFYGVVLRNNPGHVMLSASIYKNSTFDPQAGEATAARAGLLSSSETWVGYEKIILEMDCRMWSVSSLLP